MAQVSPIFIMLIALMSRRLMSKCCNHSCANRSFVALGYLYSIIACCLLLVCPQLLARDYQVEIDAPPELKTLLEKNLDLVRWRGHERLDEAALLRLYGATPDSIKALVSTEGYFSAEIHPAIDQSGAVWQIRLQVLPGTRARVQEVDLQFQGFLPGLQPTSEQLRAAWGLSVGSVFRQADWEQAKRTLLRQALTLRYPRAQWLQTEADVNLDTQQVTLRAVLQSGPAVTFGELQIDGLQRYPQSVVRRLNRIAPGDVYDEAALLELQARLQDSHYFSAVAVSAEAADAVDAGEAADAGMSPVEPSLQNLPQNPLQIPVQVSLTEQRLKKVDAGLGYSTNTGNRLQVAYSHLNLLGAQLNSALMLETRKQSARADWLLPASAAAPPSQSDTLSVALERVDLNAEVTRTATLAIKRSWGGPALSRSLTLEYRNEHKTVDGLPQVRSHTLPLSWQWTQRDFDQLLFPTRGHALTLQLGGTPVRLLADEPFIRSSIKYLQYWPLNAQNRLIGRVELGALASRHKEGIPDSYLFRAGGDQSVRGYGWQQLGEKVGDAVVGARYLATASVEYQYWPQPLWGAALFFDSGNAKDKLKDLAPKSGYGVGGRWKSPVGPINLDLAWGRAIHKYRIHFSLGVAF
jgi:translocation and assembly module TamA